MNMASMLRGPGTSTEISVTGYRSLRAGLAGWQNIIRAGDIIYRTQFFFSFVFLVCPRGLQTLINRIVRPAHGNL